MNQTPRYTCASNENWNSIMTLGIILFILVLGVTGFVAVATSSEELAKQLLFWFGLSVELLALGYGLAGADHGMGYDSGGAIALALVGLAFLAASKFYP
jgi:hypothetical protein